MDVERLVPLLRCRTCRTLRLALPEAEMHAYLDASHYNDPSMYEAVWNARRGVWSWMVDRFLSDLPVGATIVDFGASFGQLGNDLGQRGYTVVDVELGLCARTVAAAQDPKRRVVAALNDLMQQAGTMNAIVAIDSLYYVDSPRAVLADMARLLRAGGRLVIRNTSGELRWLAHSLFRRRDVLGDACWGFTVAGMAAAIQAAGLEPTDVRYLERGRGAGMRGLYYTASGAITTAFGGRLAVSPGWVMTAVKPA